MYVILSKPNPELDHNYAKMGHQWECQNSLTLFDCSVKKLEKYMCYRCTFKTNLFIEFRKHDMSRNVQFLRVYNCKYCNFETYSIFVFLMHQKSDKCIANHQNKELQCKVEEKFKLSLMNSKKEQWFKCKHCTFKAKLAVNLKRHSKYKHPTTKETQWFECGHCVYQNNESTLRKHILKKHVINSKKLFQREYPVSKLLTEDLKSRYVILAEAKWFKCKSCSYKTPRSTDLRNHFISRHIEADNIEWFQCEYCLFKTKRKFYLERHMIAKHHIPKEKQFASAHCSHKTQYKCKLDRHNIRKHNPEKVNLFQCEHCFFRTEREFGLQRHIKTKHNPENVSFFYCKQCPAKFTRSTNLKQHESSQHSVYSNML